MELNYEKFFEASDTFVKENNLLYFHLDSCTGIHIAMWRYTSQLMESSLSICGKILPYALLARLIYDEFRNRRKGVIDLRVHVSTIFTTILIFAFFEKYQWVLKEFDGLIRAFYFYIPKPETEEEMSKWAQFFNKLKDSLSIFDASNWIYLLLFRLHEFTIFALQYARSIFLMLASIFGPLAALTYFLNRGGFANWSRSYLNISCWGITLNAFEGIARAHKTVAISGEAGGISFVVGSVSIAFLIFMTPTITSWYIGNALLPNLAPVANFAARGISFAGGAIKSIAGQAIKFVPGLGPIARAAGILAKLKK